MSQGRNANLGMSKTNARWFQMFKYSANSGTITNEKGKVISIQNQSGYDNENRFVGVANQNGELYQQWDIVYADSFKGWPKKGELNKDYGLIVERPFYIVSELPNHNYLDM